MPSHAKTISRLAALVSIAWTIACWGNAAQAADTSQSGSKTTRPTMAEKYPWAVEEGEDGQDNESTAPTAGSIAALATVLIINPDSLRTSSITLTPATQNNTSGSGGTGSTGSGSTGSTGSGSTGTIQGGPGDEGSGKVEQAPEPSSMVLACLGLAFACMRGRRHRCARR